MCVLSPLFHVAMLLAKKRLFLFFFFLRALIGDLCVYVCAYRRLALPGKQYLSCFLFIFFFSTQLPLFFFLVRSVGLLFAFFFSSLFFLF